MSQKPEFYHKPLSGLSFQGESGRPRDALRADLLAICSEALAAVEGGALVRRHLRRHPLAGPVRLFAMGKAAGEMAAGAADVLGGNMLDGLVIGKHGHLARDRLAGLGLETLESGHPVPDAQSLLAGERLLDRLRREDEAHLLFLISGGTSSLVESPAAGLGLEELARATAWLLGSGLDIAAMNRVRKSLSRIKGGGLLRFLRGRRVSALAISDVPGDDPAVIGSGLLTPEPGLAAAVEALSLPPWLADWVHGGLAERRDDRVSGPPLHILAGLDQAKAAAAEAGRRIGHEVFLHARFLDGDAERSGRELAAELLDSAPGLHVWGGETTVVLPPDPGRGGRNQQLALAAATVLAGHPGTSLLSLGTDGTDGPTADAGALVDGGTLERAATHGFDADKALAGADAGSLLEASGDLVCTGPTGTNVMDLVLGLKT